ncbi:FAD binding domain-containing protein [Phytoactinopolyspora endophytica]|uniref:FAD binding domain-containing protein n=1 Tax=Phytoactinopolyspora endophytica TaxID=1642495 RepID=UPI00101C0D8C|nr:xanthine dehydrogenase family protein subunit M [Phytoactinopolyspora endophytica]
MHPFRYSLPGALQDAVDLLAEHGEDACPLAGGTDLTVGLRHGTVRPRIVVDLKRLADLRPGVSAENGAVVVTAPTVLTELTAHPTVRSALPALVEAADVVGSVHIRHRATLAGNICNASPAADTVPVLAALEASVVLEGPEGSRRLPVADFVQGNRSTDLRRGELVAVVAIPLPTDPCGTAFARMTRRRGVDLATVNVCCTVSHDGTVTFVYGAAAPRPVIVRDITGTLAAPDADRAAVDAVLDQILGRTTPITDVRASKEYRLAMLRVLSLRALHRARERLATQELARQEGDR